jgi:transcriptional regulator with XRE-family HTH domain
MNKAALARRGGITDSQVSRELNGDQQPGTDTLRAVATALEVPIYEVYVSSGLLPAESERNLFIDRIVELLKTLPEDDQEELLEMTRVKVERARRENRGRKVVRS